MMTTTVAQPTIVLQGGRFSSLAFSPDSKLLAAGQHNGTLKIWTPEGREWFTFAARQTADFDFGSMVKAIAFSPDGELVAWAGGNRDVTILDSKTKQVTQRSAKQEREITALSFIGPKVLAIATSRGPIRLWDLVTDETRIALVIKQRSDEPPVGLFIGPMTGNTRDKALSVAIDYEVVVLNNRA